MLKLKTTIAATALCLIGVPLAVCTALFIVGAWLYLSADFLCPNVSVDIDGYELSTDSDSVKVCRNGSLLLNRYGLREVRVAGTPTERGATYGAMCKELIEFQEDAFVNRIREMIPDERWVEFLHKIIIIFNRGMAAHIPEEYRQEIYAMSLFGTDKYDSYGSPYVRQLNYHAAHDIGHAMQEYMLVGCSSFAVWGDESATNELIIGRNFDFYAGDDFAKNKVVLFAEPDSGYKFASVSWPGMAGVLSGMNEKGLTVTINAAKGPLPLASAMPISLLARHILQYAANIGEAFDMARQYETFVSESILVGSACDRCAAIIEKTPDAIALYKTSGSKLICTNHYQSALFENDRYNVGNIAGSDSQYRHERLDELLRERTPIDNIDAVDILRDRYGKGGADIGLTNEKSINQFIAHHSVVFNPERLRMWVSTSPYQYGEYVCYDLNDIFGAPRDPSTSYASPRYNIAADSTAAENECPAVRRYRERYRVLRAAIDKKQRLTSEYISQFIADNPCYYQVYNTVGDYMMATGDKRAAVEYWRQATILEIPHAAERDEIINKIKHNAKP